MLLLTTSGRNLFFILFYIILKITWTRKLFPPCPPVVTPEAENERLKAFDPRLTYFHSISGADSDRAPHNNIQKDTL